MELGNLPGLTAGISDDSCPSCWEGISSLIKNGITTSRIGGDSGLKVCSIIVEDVNEFVDVAVWTEVCVNS